MFRLFQVKIYVLKKCGSEISVILDPNVWSSQSDSCRNRMVLGLALGLHLMTNLKASWNKQIKDFALHLPSVHKVSNSFNKLSGFRINFRKIFPGFYLPPLCVWDGAWGRLLSQRCSGYAPVWKLSEPENPSRDATLERKTKCNLSCC